VLSQFPSLETRALTDKAEGGGVDLDFGASNSMVNGDLCQQHASKSVLEAIAGQNT
jgi:hypothetical protein